ncbi:unnamed protein product [Durusdinium trenchii]|uniref:Uncharacterized protein n=1 Tax=Durusdinium trenchii TaxID=1381693 RepID=A0ABP0J277_9DINO
MPPRELAGLKPGDKVIFWPTIPDPFKEYPSSWPVGGEMTFLEEVPSAARPCKARLADDRTAWVFWCDVALPGTKGEWKCPMVKVQDLAGEVSGEFPLTSSAEDLLKEVFKDKGQDLDAVYSFVLGSTKLQWGLPLASQGVEPGSSLTLVKEPASSKAGVYSFNMKSYPEDRYSEWDELELMADKTCTWAYCTAGPGRCSTVSTSSKDVKKRGRWTLVGPKVIVSWDGGEMQNFNNLGH